MSSLDEVYGARFGAAEIAAKDAIWREITAYLGRWIPTSSTVLDLACDRGYFIRHAIAAEKWACDVRDVGQDVGPGVAFVQTDGLLADQVLPVGHFDVVFMSNYLEHLTTSDAVIEQLRVVRRLLRRGGRVIILQPNLKAVGGAYWDFIDHHVALTDRSLTEAAQLAGIVPERIVARFLPYSTKGRLPSHPLLVRAYLRFPVVWRIVGGQTLFIGRALA